jgi:hypothetical protein
MLRKVTTNLIPGLRKSGNPIPTPLRRRIFPRNTILLRITRRALIVAAIAVAKTTAVAVIVAEVDAGAAEADAIVADARRVRAAEICLPRNMLRRKAVNLGVTIRVATITAAATKEATKLGVASRVDSNLGVPSSTVLTIVAPRIPAQPASRLPRMLPRMQRKNRFFFPASLWRSIAASLSPRLLRPLPSRNHTSRSPKSKRQPPVHQAD